MLKRGLSWIHAALVSLLPMLSAGSVSISRLAGNRRRAFAHIVAILVIIIVILVILIILTI